jgi:hypothetical protein
VLKKYLPFIILIAAVALFFWIRSNQRGSSPQQNITTEAVHAEPFIRDTNMIVYSRHAKCRMDCRRIDEAEVKEILLEGRINYDKVEEDSRGISYPIEGLTKDKQFVRIVVAPHDNEIVVVTVIDLEKDWQCNCN